MTQDEKLDEALKGTFPASDAFYLAPKSTASDAPRKSLLKEKEVKAPAGSWLFHQIGIR